ncbi:YaiI/YqxD family protein [Corticicoccus populi]|uniref:UPF0178 protein ACFSX4_12335 n=1 Tax=Corticicoccus populi TaxID=1812821 RepID=A0ABW5X0D6_9STAP
MKVIVDADACPVKDIIIKEAKKKDIPVVLVSSFSHFSSKDLDEHVSVVYVDSGSDAADFKIVALIDQGDIAVTQDYGLASLLLPKKCRVLHHKGFEYTGDNMNHLLETRYIGSMIRKGGGRTKGPKPLSKEDKQSFLGIFKKVISEELSQRK